MDVRLLSLQVQIYKQSTKLYLYRDVSEPAGGSVVAATATTSVTEGSGTSPTIASTDAAQPADKVEEK